MLKDGGLLWNESYDTLRWIKALQQSRLINPFKDYLSGSHTNHECIQGIITQLYSGHHLILFIILYEMKRKENAFFVVVGGGGGGEEAESTHFAWSKIPSFPGFLL